MVKWWGDAVRQAGGPDWSDSMMGMVIARLTVVDEITSLLRILSESFEHLSNVFFKLMMSLSKGRGT